MAAHEKLDYIEFPVKNMEAAKQFFANVFQWSFTDYGPDYSSFSNAGLDGGMVLADVNATVKTGSVLLVFYSEDLEKTQAKIENAGGVIVKPVFSFPGGRRFHFGDPSGNEFAVWSDK